MQLYIHLPTNLKTFELFLENKEYILWWKSKDEKQIAEFFLKNFPGEVMNELSPQYEVNFVSLRKLKQFDNNITNNIQWIYYGSDNCEYLTPTKAEVEKALSLYEQANKKYFFKKWKKWFVLVLPYVGNRILQRAKESLDYLNSQWKFEVVVNDLWILRHIEKECKNLTPIAWRLLHKLLKTPLVDTYWNRAHVPAEKMKNAEPKQIDEIQKQIVENQNKFYNSIELSTNYFVKFLDKHWINQVAVDFMNSRYKIFEKDYKKWIDLYYPWALVFTGRLCDTSAIENPARWNYALDEVCPRTCWRYDLFYKLKTVWYNLIQRWNAAFRSELDIEKVPEKFLYNKKNRIIYAPFVSV